MYSGSNPLETSSKAVPTESESLFCLKIQASRACYWIFKQKSEKTPIGGFAFDALGTLLDYPNPQSCACHWIFKQKSEKTPIGGFAFDAMGALLDYPNPESRACHCIFKQKSEKTPIGGFAFDALGACWIMQIRECFLAKVF